MPRPSTITSCLLVALAGAVSCSSPTEQREFDLSGARLDIISGNQQSGRENTLLAQPIVVQLLNSKGRPVKGQVVTFTPLRESGSAWAGSAVTDADGFAKEWWIVGSYLWDNYLEARTVDPVTGERVVLATVKATSVRWTNPQIQCQFPGQTSWVPASATDCPSTQLPKDVARGGSLQILFRVVDDVTPVGGVPVSTIALKPSSITPAGAYTGTDGVVATIFTAGTVAGNSPVEASFRVSTVTLGIVNIDPNMRVFP